MSRTESALRLFLAVALALFVALALTTTTATDTESVEAQAWQAWDEAGLDRPAVTIEWQLDDCQVEGWAWHDNGDITMCVLRVGVLTHEIAHAWINEHTGKEQRQAYMEIHGLDSWRDGPWAHRGVEHAAETVRWHVLGEIKRTSDTQTERQAGLDALLSGRKEK